MAGTSNFLSKKDFRQWRFVLSKYGVTLKEKAQTKPRAPATKELMLSDNWYQNDLPTRIQGRDPPYIDQGELVQLMKWKLSRGKFRPRLVQLAESNKDETVIKLSTDAFKKCKKGSLREAVKILSELKGIGPATASAILTAAYPAKAAFMADEPTYALLNEGHLKYNLDEYLRYMKLINEYVKQLTQDDPEFEWTAHKVELAIWTHCVASKLKPELLEDSESEGSENKSPENRATNGKRKSLETTSSGQKKKKKT